MRRWNLYTIGGLALMMAAAMPADGWAQTIAESAPQVDGSARAIREAVAPATGVVPPAARMGGRRRAILLGTAAGASVGVYVGEVYLGQKGDFPHGWDMLVGGGIGAGVGAMVGSLLGPRQDKGGYVPPRSGVTVIPTLSRSRKAVLVKLQLK